MKHESICGIIILAGGNGQIRGKYKTLLKVEGLTMLQRVVKACQPLKKPIVVVANGNEYVKERIRQDVRSFHDVHLVLQPWRLGTAQAFAHGVQHLHFLGCRNAIVLHADMPLWTTETINGLLTVHRNKKKLMTVGVIDPELLLDPWPHCFKSLGKFFLPRGKKNAMEM